MAHAIRNLRAAAVFGRTVLVSCTDQPDMVRPVAHDYAGTAQMGFAAIGGMDPRPLVRWERTGGVGAAVARAIGDEIMNGQVWARLVRLTAWDNRRWSAVRCNCPKAAAGPGRSRY